MRGLIILLSWALITILIAVAGGDPLLWGLGALSWLAITLAVVLGGKKERAERKVERQAVQQSVWADVLTVASSAQQQQQEQQVAPDQDFQ
jgi:EamA domain-containing membrane protein RarD